MNVSCVNGKTIINGKEYDLPQGCSLGMKKGILYVNGEPYESEPSESSKKEVTIIIQDCKIEKFETRHTKKIEISKCEITKLKNSKGDIKISQDSTVGSITASQGDVKCGDVSGSVQISTGDLTCGNISGSANVSIGDIKARDIRGACATSMGSIKRGRGFDIRTTIHQTKRVDLKRDLGDGGLD